MRRGRKICDELKAIRQRIADDNGIEYSPAECTHEGECAGTCPRCESEVRYLEGELRRRSGMGQAIVIGGLTLGLSAFGSCGGGGFTTDTVGMAEDTDTLMMVNQGDSTCEMLEGDVMAEPDTLVTVMPPTEGMIMREPDSIPPTAEPKKQ